MATSCTRQRWVAVQIECGAAAGAGLNASCVIQNLGVSGEVRAQSPNRFIATGGTSASATLSVGALSAGQDRQGILMRSSPGGNNWLLGGGPANGAFDGFQADCDAANPTACAKPFWGAALQGGTTMDFGCQWDGRCAWFTRSSWLLQVGFNDTAGSLRDDTDVTEIFATNHDGVRVVSERTTTPGVLNNDTSAVLNRAQLQVEALSGAQLNHTQRNATSGLGDSAGLALEATITAELFWEHQAATNDTDRDFPSQHPDADRVSYVAVGPGSQQWH